jgi:SAM-dependent methyltransferase
LCENGKDCPVDNNVNISRQIQQLYREFPYPPVGKSKPFQPKWRLAPMEWIDALWQPAYPPRRILVAGCGTGNEAFALRHRFPAAQIVAADFSDRSIALARKLQGQFSGKKTIRFVQLDLSSEQFGEIVGRNFDFVSCHGVLTYVARPKRILRNLTACLAPGGALYLGVNGAGHFSEKWRHALPAFGLGPNKWEDGARLRGVLKMYDALSEHRVGWIAKQPAEYLAGDLFGPLIRNLPLVYWTTLCRECGLHFLGSYYAQKALAPVFNNNLYELLIPRSRAEIHGLVDQIAPASFHCLVFARRSPFVPPWHDAEALKRCLIASTKLYALACPRRKGSWKTLRRVAIKSLPTNTFVQLGIPEWALEILRHSGSQLEIGQILREALPEISPKSLRKHLYLLYLLALINLRPASAP